MTSRRWMLGALVLLLLGGGLWLMTAARSALGTFGSTGAASSLASPESPAPSTASPTPPSSGVPDPRPALAVRPVGVPVGAVRDDAPRTSGGPAAATGGASEAEVTELEHFVAVLKNDSWVLVKKTMARRAMSREELVDLKLWTIAHTEEIDAMAVDVAAGRIGVAAATIWIEDSHQAYVDVVGALARGERTAH